MNNETPFVYNWNTQTPIQKSDLWIAKMCSNYSIFLEPLEERRRVWFHLAYDMYSEGCQSPYLELYIQYTAHSVPTKTFKA